MPFWGSSQPAVPAETESETSSKADYNDPKASASHAAGTAWLVGHLNHLTDDQEEKLQQFKELSAERGYYTPQGSRESKDHGKPSHDDATMLRFLRARKFDVNAAWDQFRDTEDWRKDNAIGELYENIDVESYDAARRMYPQWTGRRDRRGIPVYVFQIKHLDNKKVAEYNSTMTSPSATAESHKSSSVPQRLLRLFALYENLLRFVMPLCSSLDRPNPETPIVSSNNIVDVSGVGLKQFWNLKGHMQDASVLATAHYPETLDRIFIIGAPAFFPTVWGWIKRWFDPVTTSKTFILSASEITPTLTSFMDPSSIPKQYGGELDWQWGDMPNLDEPARELIGALETPTSEGETHGRLIKGPVLFKGDEIEILGTVDGKSRRDVIPVPSKEKHQSELENGQVANGVDATVAVTDEKVGLENVTADEVANVDATVQRATA